MFLMVHVKNIIARNSDHCVSNGLLAFPFLVMSHFQLILFKLHSILLGRTILFYQRIIAAVLCGVVRCHPNCPFLAFLLVQPRTGADVGSLLKYYVQQRDIVTYHIDKMAV